MRRIGVITSGGDAPGMNAALRSVVRTACGKGIEVYAFYRGYQGIIDNDYKVFTARDVGNIIQLGGTVILTSRCKDFMTKAGFNKAVKNLKDDQIDGLIVIGGNGSFKGAYELNLAGIPTVGIPGTIDNDLGYTDRTIGFDTAVDTVVSLMNNVRDTVTAHERLTVVEVMGRYCGDIALLTGIACGADVILVPEVKMTPKEMCEKLLKSRSNGKKASIVVLAEGAGKAEDIVKTIKDMTGIDGRYLVVGHIQRGGSPSTIDRVLATRLGNFAVELLCKNKFGYAVGEKNGKLISVKLDDAVNEPNKFDKDLYSLIDRLSI